MTWTERNRYRFTRESAGRNSAEDLTLTVYKTIQGTWKWRADDANDFTTIESGTCPTAAAAKSAADAFANR